MSARVLLLVLCLGPLAASALGPFEENPPEVVRGLTALEAGKPEEALEAFDAATARLGTRPELEHNRALALAQLGRRDEAIATFNRLANDTTLSTRLRAKSAYDLGNVHAAGSQRKEALAAYRKALMLDPQDADARHNLEVLLRNLPPPQESPPDAGQPDGGQDAGQDGGGPDGGAEDAGQDGGTDGGADGGADGGGDGGEDGGQGDGGDGQDGGQDDGGSDGGQDGGAPQQGDGGADGGQDAGQDAGDEAGEQGQPDGGEPRDGGEGTGDGGQDAGADAGTEPQEAGEGDVADAGVDAESLTEEQAEQLLDSMKQNEKNLQLWRFQGKKRPRNADEKDW